MEFYLIFQPPVSPCHPPFDDIQNIVYWFKASSVARRLLTRFGNQSSMTNCAGSLDIVRSIGPIKGPLSKLDCVDYDLMEYFVLN